MSNANPRTISIPEAAAMLGISLSATYRAVSRGDFPVPVIQIGGRRLILRDPFEALLRDGSRKDSEDGGSL